MAQRVRQGSVGSRRGSSPCPKLPGRPRMLRRYGGTEERKKKGAGGSERRGVSGGEGGGRLYPPTGTVPPHDNPPLSAQACTATGTAHLEACSSPTSPCQIRPTP